MPDYYTLTWGELKAFAAAQKMPDDAELYFAHKDSEGQRIALEGLHAEPAEPDTRSGTNPANDNSLPARLVLHASAEEAQVTDEFAVYVIESAE